MQSRIDGSVVEFMSGCFDGSGISDARVGSTPAGTLLVIVGWADDFISGFWVRKVRMAFATSLEWAGLVEGYRPLRGLGFFFRSHTPHLRAGLMNGVADATRGALRSTLIELLRSELLAGTSKAVCLAFAWALASLAGQPLRLPFGFSLGLGKTCRRRRLSPDILSWFCETF